jgi:hypothetical protein
MLSSSMRATRNPISSISPWITRRDRSPLLPGARVGQHIPIDLVRKPGCVVSPNLRGGLLVTEW